MRFYKEVRFCKSCKTRFVLEPKKPKSFYCPECVKKFVPRRNLDKE